MLFLLIGVVVSLNKKHMDILIKLDESIERMWWVTKRKGFLVKVPDSGEVFFNEEYMEETSRRAWRISVFLQPSSRYFDRFREIVQVRIFANYYKKVWEDLLHGKPHHPISPSFESTSCSIAPASYRVTYRYIQVIVLCMYLSAYHRAYAGYLPIICMCTISSKTTQKRFRWLITQSFF